MEDEAAAPAHETVVVPSDRVTVRVRLRNACKTAHLSSHGKPMRGINGNGPSVFPAYSASFEALRRGRSPTIP
jgi:hypothetical protein